MSVQNRTKFVKQAKLCTNCLSSTHIINECTSKWSCSTCHQRHHTLLHASPQAQRSTPRTNAPNVQHTTAESTPPVRQTQNSSNSSELPCCSKHSPVQSLHAANDNQILLPTAMVAVEHEGELFQLRALIDQGSERTFISSKVQKRLKLPFEHSKFEISGMGGQVVQKSSKLCRLTLVASKAMKKIKAHAIVLPQLTKNLPTSTISRKIWQQFKLLELADPSCHIPGQTDMVIGSDILPQILLEGIKKVCGSILAQQTIFGWILSSPITENVVSFSSNETLSSQLRKFWEEEEIPQPPQISPEDQACEQAYATTTTRAPNG
ncbi:uncharacterized protein [Eurosta solidaginis]|uniref:uncharacterized protein isoform X2 n=1 Tax=Eurosta solidaginis TaxID=178769 RepID=UPI003530BE5E